MWEYLLKMVLMRHCRVDGIKIFYEKKDFCKKKETEKSYILRIRNGAEH